jgi:hypothetical protein
MNEQQLAAVKQALEALEMVAARTGARWALEQGYAGHLEAITTLQSIISQDALDKKAENARELGLDYEPAPVQEKNQSPYPEYDRGFSNGWDRGFAAAQTAPVAQSLKDAVFTVIEGFNIPPDVRKILESAYYNAPPTPQPVPVKTYHDGKPWPVQPVPHECQTEAEKTAYAFGWWKAMEYVREHGVIK